ncbi:MAG TPA: mechanosensitive ion channel domain-containing protein [Kofleriaceae bacterium]|nr:mechanosensitive ion channel domain-containing protein [Kofleriaceae bacterium]
MQASASLDYVRYLAESYLFPTTLRLIVAGAVFFLGRALAKAVMRGFDRVMERAKIDVSLRKFLGDVGYAVLLVAVVIAALDTLGIKTTAVLAVLGAAGLAVGLALQGSLSNFAAGVMLIILRPYKVNDIVVIGKYLGRVDAIKVFNTILITNDNREVTIPNGQIIAAPIENLTVLGRRRVDLLITVQHTTNLGDVKQLIERVYQADPRIEREPAPTVEVAEITDTAIKLHFRPWTTAEQFDQVAAETMDKVKNEMQKASVPFTVALQSPTA